MQIKSKFLQFAFALTTLFFWSAGHAQFYRGSQQTFGKSRVQHDLFVWQQMEFQEFNLYFYGTGRDLAEFVGRETQVTIATFRQRLDYELKGKIHVLVFNNQNQFRQSNIGLETGGEDISGVSRIQGNKLFVYFEGDHSKLREQIREGLAGIYLNQFMFGENWREIVKNNTLMSLPDWYMNGLTSYVAHGWNVEIDDEVRDIVLNRTYRKFNRLGGDEARIAGHSLWNYIATVYGADVIPNILYMTRISRNIESGFLFVIGISLNNLIQEAQSYYRNRYAADDKNRFDFENDELSLKWKGRNKRTHHGISISPDGSKVAYVNNQLGQWRVMLHDVESGKTKQMMKGDHKLDRIPDLSYPLITWHPNGDVLAVLTEKKGEILLNLYDFEEKKWNEREIRRMERVLDIDYGFDGKTMLLTAIVDGRTDLFEYKLLTNSTVRLTNDIWDEVDATFVPGVDRNVIFASNRPNDSLLNEKSASSFPRNYDIFVLDRSEEDLKLHQLTSTPNTNEMQPFVYEGDKFMFLSDEKGFTNRYLGIVDSAIAKIDTTIHYRYFTRTWEVSNYRRNILEQSVATDAREAAQLVYMNGRYHIYKVSMDEMKEITDAPTSKYRDIQERQSESSKNVPSGSALINRIEVEEAPIEKKKADPNAFSLENYELEEEKREPISELESKPEEVAADTSKVQEDGESKKRFLVIRDEEKSIEQIDDGGFVVSKEFRFPRQENYNTAFIRTDLQTTFDFDFANQIYQPFNGGPYVNPGMGVTSKFSIYDVMEDYNWTGGLRYGLNGDNMEYFLSYSDRRKKLDKTYSFQRQSMRQVGANGLVFKSFIHQGKAAFKWPFSEVLSVTGTGMLRFDRGVTQSISLATLEAPDTELLWAGAKFELVFDNVRNRGLNIYNGTRWKIFAENYRIVGDQTNIYIAGIDYRTYVKIHRDLIWATRFSASTSLGHNRLVYYMGSVDNWMVLSDRERFNRDQNISQDQNYMWQTLASPMRGYIQNIRNGNSFALINTEIRLPLFRYIMNRPIKSDFFKNFQVVGIADVGTAWTGANPYSDENSFNIKTYDTGPGGTLEVRVRNKVEPIVAGFGYGLRSKLLGYFVKWDFVWGLEDGVIREPVTMLSLGLDF